jgi:hypothetical protein
VVFGVKQHGVENALGPLELLGHVRLSRQRMFRLSLASVFRVRTGPSAVPCREERMDHAHDKAERYRRAPSSAPGCPRITSLKRPTTLHAETANGGAIIVVVLQTYALARSHGGGHRLTLGPALRSPSLAVQRTCPEITAATASCVYTRSVMACRNSPGPGL